MQGIHTTQMFIMIYVGSCFEKIKKRDNESGRQEKKKLQRNEKPQFKINIQKEKQNILNRKKKQLDLMPQNIMLLRTQNLGRNSIQQLPIQNLVKTKDLSKEKRFSSNRPLSRLSYFSSQNQKKEIKAPLQMKKRFFNEY